MYVYKLVVAVLLTEALVELFTESRMFESLRNKLSFSDMTEYFFNCGYCQSVWVGLLVAMFFNMDIGFCSYYIDVIISGLIVHRLSNLYHGFHCLIESRIGNILDVHSIGKLNDNEED